MQVEGRKKCVAQAGLELVILLPLPPSANPTGVRHHYRRESAATRTYSNLPRPDVTLQGTPPGCPQPRRLARPALAPRTLATTYTHTHTHKPSTPPHHKQTTLHAYTPGIHFTHCLARDSLRRQHDLCRPPREHTLTAAHCPAARPSARPLLCSHTGLLSLSSSPLGPQPSDTSQPHRRAERLSLLAARPAPPARPARPAPPAPPAHAPTPAPARPPSILARQPAAGHRSGSARQAPHPRRAASCALRHGELRPSSLGTGPQQNQDLELSTAAGLLLHRPSHAHPELKPLPPSHLSPPHRTHPPHP